MLKLLVLATFILGAVTTWYKYVAIKNVCMYIKHNIQ